MTWPPDRSRHPNWAVIGYPDGTTDTWLMAESEFHGSLRLRSPYASRDLLTVLALGWRVLEAGPEARRLLERAGLPGGWMQ